MAERYTDMPAFDREAVSAALDTAGMGIQDVTHGRGQAMTVAGKTLLETFPEAGVARVTTSDARVELYRIPRYSLTEASVIFEQGEGAERTRLVVRRDGRVSFVPFLRQPDGPRATTAGSGDPTPTPPPPTASEAATAPQSTPSSGAKTERSEAGEQELLQLRGRLGREPWHVRAEGDEPISGFPLAVNSDNGAKAVWHDVVVFGDTALGLEQAAQRRQIRKGTLVDVTGVEAVRQVTQRSGKVKDQREFHARQVAPVRSTQARPMRRP
jgi:hypothetical protein